MMKAVEPEFIPLPRSVEVFGVSRSGHYRLAAAGRIRLLKLGARTLVDAGSVRAFLATLPPVEVRPDPRRRHGHAEVVAAE